MSRIMLLKIESLLVRTVDLNGLKFRLKGNEVSTGVVVGSTDEIARAPGNTGLIDLDSGSIQLNCAAVATMPMMVDAMTAGHIPPSQTGPVKLSFSEFGTVKEDGSGFNTEGKGSIGPGSILSSASIPAKNNGVACPPARGKTHSHLIQSLASGESVDCVISPESFLDIKLPRPLGGGSQRIHIMGGFTLVPLGMFGHLKGTKKGKK